MGTDIVVDIAQRAIMTAIYLSAPVMIASLVVGLIVSLLQAVTQINEVTLTFLPKVLAVALALFLTLPWMLSVIVGFTSELLLNIPSYLR